MPAAGWATVIISGVVVVVVALALLRVIIHLKHVSFTLGTIIVGVRSIAFQTKAVPPAIKSVNANLAPVRAVADGIGR